MTALNENIVQVNSVLGTPSPLVAWAERFPAMFADNGFDVVIGNPPYVRQEWITDIKDELKKHYASYDGTADLDVYFYELGLKLLKPGGRIGHIVTNKWLKAGYGENLRKHYCVFRPASCETPRESRPRPVGLLKRCRGFLIPVSRIGVGNPSAGATHSRSEVAAVPV